MASSGQDVCEELIIHIPLVLEPSRWPECCIYRVPKILRKVNEVAYTPKLISIGPLHHGDQELGDMEVQKLRYFKDFCNRSTECQPKDLASIVQENEEKIRHCYEETSKLCSKKYVSMILLDAIFIIELFLRTSEKIEKTEEEFDYILSKPWLDVGIRNDLILLENQLPFFILEELFKSSFSTTNTSFLEHACNYFEEVYSHISGLGKEVNHFTDLKRYFLCPPKIFLKEVKRVKKSCELLYSATKLDETGVKFEAYKDKEEEEEDSCSVLKKIKNNNSSRRFLEIKFKKDPCLEYCPWLNCSWILNCLPCLKCFPCLESMQVKVKFRPIEVYDQSESHYRNIMALEQCHYPLKAYVCNYFAFLDHLIDTDKDVDLLVHKKIIVNRLGSNDALAKVINKLGLEITVSDSYYKLHSQQLNDHCKGSWNKIMASLTSVYFRDFWRGTATVVGLILLGITLYNFIKDFF